MEVEPLASGWDWDHFYTEVVRIKTSDRALGSVLILGALVGVLGNISAIFYFWPRRGKTIHDLQYLMITIVDVVSTSVFGLPVAISLFNNRRAVLFENDVFCTSWTLVILFTGRMSMFLAMMISITRTIAMKCPSCPIKRSWVIGPIAGYAAYLILIYVIYVPQGWHFAIYAAKVSSCGIDFMHRGIPLVAMYIGMISYVVELIVPSLTTFVCFVIGTWFLMTQPVLGNANDRKFRRVSITIAIFTGVFLVCNAPCFLCQLWKYFVWLINRKLPLKQPDKFHFYDQLLLQRFPIFVNAVINPFLYLLRMRGYQNWVRRTARIYPPANVNN